jgi:TolB protein
MNHLIVTRFIAVVTLLCSSVVFSLDLELTKGINAALPIGINSFAGDSQAQELTDVIDNDLRLSGQFRLIPASQGRGQSLSLWKSAGADTVLSGHVTRIGSDRYEVNFELVDSARPGLSLLRKSYQVTARDIRALAHHISDEVYQKLTGERGIFSTRMAYVLVKRGVDKTQYSLEVADADSSNPRSLLVSSEPIMSPAWSPDGKQIAYVTFERKRAQIFSVIVATGQRRLITDFPGINGAPSWSPDGRELAVVLSKGGNAKIYTVDLATGSMKQRTFGEAIDTEPRYSPDGQTILFTSGRGGSPQIYRLSRVDGAISRVTYDGNYNARASYTPNQQFIVMLHREDRQFNIGLQDVKTGRIIPLTNSQMDESPSISPNGRLILYATHYQDKGVLAITSLDGRIKMRLPSRDGDVQEPAWSPYLD